MKTFDLELKNGTVYEIELDANTTREALHRLIVDGPRTVSAKRLSFVPFFDLDGITIATACIASISIPDSD